MGKASEARAKFLRNPSPQRGVLYTIWLQVVNSENAAPVIPMPRLLVLPPMTS